MKYIKITASALAVLALLLLVYKVWQDANGKTYIKSFFTAANNQDCQKLQLLNGIRNINKDILCPRGDVGNFMVIDKVSYQIEDILGDRFSNRKQVLVKVCVEARGQAAWNEGKYKECTSDPRIIEFTSSLTSWKPNMTDFTNMSELLNKSGAEPAGYREYSEQCWKTRIQERLNGGNPKYDCNNVVESDVLYAIKTHKFVETGKAR